MHVVNVLPESMVIALVHVTYPLSKQVAATTMLIYLLEFYDSFDLPKWYENG